MNYLAHFYLSHHDENLIVGNYIADDVKGNKYLDYPSDIQEGILLHRLIDDYTDNHQRVLNSTKTVRPTQRKYAPVVIDLLYDHLLAKDWKNHANDDLLEFTNKVYRILNQNKNLLPEHSKMRLYYMEKHNWLYNYRHYEGIKRALSGLSRRTIFENNMHEAASLLEVYEPQIKADFNEFFPEIRKHVRAHISI